MGFEVWGGVREVERSWGRYFFLREACAWKRGGDNMFILLEEF